MVRLGNPRGAGAGERPGRWAPAKSSVTLNPDAPQRRGFASTEHLAADAVVAYVDGVLPASAAARADAHLRLCPECVAEITAQRAARSALRACCDVHIPDRLLGALTEIPTREYDLRRPDGRAREQ